MKGTAQMDAATMARRQAVLARDNHFGSEDTPAADDFMQVGSHAAHKKAKRFPGDEADDDGDGYEHGDREAHARDADSSDFSAEQFLRADDGRDPMSRTAQMDAATMSRRQAVLARDNHFGSEDTPAADE